VRKGVGHFFPMIDRSRHWRTFLSGELFPRDITQGTSDCRHSARSDHWASPIQGAVRSTVSVLPPGHGQALQGRSSGAHCLLHV